MCVCVHTCMECTLLLLMTLLGPMLLCAFQSWPLLFKYDGLEFCGAALQCTSSAILLSC